MQYMREFFQGIGHFWAITITLIVVAVLAITGLYVGGVVFTSKVVLPAQKNLAIQHANNDYAANQQSQQYQATYLQEISQGFTQLFSDQRSLTRDQQTGDATLIGEDKVALAADAGKLCQYGQHINATSEQTMTATDVAWFQTNCTEGVVAPQSVYFITTGQPASVGVNP